MDGQDAPHLIETRQLTKRFSGTLALDCVDFSLGRGEIHALLGANGAGKSTLIKILAGVYGADGGEIRMHGAPVEPARHRLPISFIHQELGLVEAMTVAENIAVTAGYARKLGLISWMDTASAASVALEAMGSGVDPQAQVAGLPAAERSIIAIARALVVEADVLVLDEPTAALPKPDVLRLHAALRRLRDAGIGIIYVTHRLDEVFRLADRVTVLRDGRRVSSKLVEDTNSTELVFDIVGKALADVYARPSPLDAETVLAAERMTARGAGPVTFAVKAGELLGLVGLRGAGHDVIGRGLAGDTPITSGRVELNGHDFAPRHPKDAIAQGVGFISSKRAQEGMAPGLTVRENVYMNPVALGRKPLQPIRPREERLECEEVLERFSVVPRDPEHVIATLSGGNQQKVIVARWMETRARLLILEEPTFGVDVGSKAEIYRLLQVALDNGAAGLLVSSDFEEVAGIAHRALVFNRGRICAEVSRADLSVERLTALASGATESRRPS